MSINGLNRRMNKTEGTMIFTCKDCGMVHFIEVSIKNGKLMGNRYLFFPCQRKTCGSYYLFDWEIQGVRKISREYYLKGLKLGVK